MRTRILGGIVALVIGLGFWAPGARAVGPIVSLTISPSTADLSAGSSQSFTVQGKDAVGETADMTANAVFTTTDPLGNTAGQKYTAGKSGTWVVTATYNTLSATASVTVIPGPVAEISVNPNSSPEFLQKGKKRTFTGVTYDAFNNIVTAGTIDWTTDGGIGTITKLDASSASFSATDAGTGTVTAYSANVKESVDVTVTNPPATNTNANVNANDNANVAAPVNDNSNANLNENTNAVGNVDDSTVAPTNGTDTSPTASDSTCKAWSKSTWVWVYIAYLALVLGALVPIRKSRVRWWWVGPFLLTVAALWMYFQFRCYPVYPALPYLILLTGIVATSWYNWQRTASPQQ